MKKKRYLLGFLLLLVFTVFGCATQEAPIEKAAKPVVEDVPQEAVEAPVQEPQTVEETKEEQTIAEEPIIAELEPVVEKKEEFQIFNPVLTYEGAYNGPLYGTSEQIGATSMDSYFNNLDRNGINFFIGMFPIFGEPQKDSLVSHQGLGYVIDAAQKHPHRIIPFFNPGIGGEGVEKYLGVTLTGWYKKTLVTSNNLAGKGFIRGFGEVETQEWDASHNDQRVLQ